MKEKYLRYDLLSIAWMRVPAREAMKLGLSFRHAQTLMARLRAAYKHRQPHPRVVPLIEAEARQALGRPKPLEAVERLLQSQPQTAST